VTVQFDAPLFLFLTTTQVFAVAVLTRAIAVEFFDLPHKKTFRFFLDELLFQPGPNIHLEQCAMGYTRVLEDRC
jgi:hypothetical protein